MPPLAKELLSTIRGDHWKVSPDPEDHRRRSVYLFVRRNLRVPLLEAFDRPDTIASCPRRNRSTTAPQALTMWNSEFSLNAARHLAGFLLAQDSDENEERIALCYQQTFGRSPTPAELKAATEFILQQSQILRDEGRDARSWLCPNPSLTLSILHCHRLDRFLPGDVQFERVCLHRLMVSGGSPTTTIQEAPADCQSAPL